MKKMLFAGILISALQLLSGAALAEPMEEAICETNTDGNWKDLGGDPSPAMGEPDQTVPVSNTAGVITGGGEPEKDAAPPAKKN